MGTAAGSLTANVALDMVNALEGLMPAVGWTLVDTVTLNGTYRVWQNPAANNQSGVDFYVTLFRANDVNTAINVLLHEGYDLANKQISGYAPEQIVNAVAPNFTTASSPTVTLDSAAVHRFQIVGANGNTYFMTAGRNRITWAISNNPGGMAGAIDSLIEAPAVDTCLVLGSFHNAVGRTTREPWAVSGASTSSGNQYFHVFPTSWGPATLDAYTNKVMPGNIVWHGRTAAANVNFRRGTIHDMWIGPTNGPLAAAVPGDTVEVPREDGLTTDTYVHLGQQRWIKRTAVA